MAIEFKTPEESDVNTMKEFAGIIDTALTFVDKSTLSHVSHVIASKLQEALFWFSHGVLNKPVVEGVLEVASEIANAVQNSESSNQVESES